MIALWVGLSCVVSLALGVLIRRGREVRPQARAAARGETPSTPSPLVLQLPR